MALVSFVSVHPTRNRLNTCEWDECHAPLISIFYNRSQSTSASKCNVMFEWYCMTVQYCSAQPWSCSWISSFKCIHTMAHTVTDNCFSITCILCEYTYKTLNWFNYICVSNHCIGREIMHKGYSYSHIKKTLMFLTPQWHYKKLFSVWYRLICQYLCKQQYTLNFTNVCMMYIRMCVQYSTKTIWIVLHIK